MKTLKRAALPALLLAHGAAAAVPLAHVMNAKGDNTILFNSISTQPTTAASNSFRATTGATINGAAISLSGYKCACALWLRGHQRRGPRRRHGATIPAPRRPVHRRGALPRRISPAARTLHQPPLLRSLGSGWA